jgi:hypothetical protein
MVTATRNKLDSRSLAHETDTATTDRLFRRSSLCRSACGARHLAIARRRQPRFTINKPSADSKSNRSNNKAAHSTRRCQLAHHGGKEGGSVESKCAEAEMERNEVT